MKRLRVFGARMRASVALDLIAWQFADRYQVEGFYDDCPGPDGRGPGGLPILGTLDAGLEQMAGGDAAAFLALGTRAAGRACRLLRDLRRRGVAVASLVSPAAIVSSSARLGDGALVMPGVFLGCDVSVGDLFCAHGGSTVEHHCRLGHHVLLGPGVSIAGVCRVGNGCFLGAGAAVIPERRIGSGTLVGAGSVVTHDLPPYVIAYGNPAVVRRSATPDDEVPAPGEFDDVPGGEAP